MRRLSLFLWLGLSVGALIWAAGCPGQPVLCGDRACGPNEVCVDGACVVGVACGDDICTNGQSCVNNGCVSGGDPSEGAALYASVCAACHGSFGSGGLNGAAPYIRGQSATDLQTGVETHGVHSEVTLVEEDFVDLAAFLAGV